MKIKKPLLSLALFLVLPACLIQAGDEAKAQAMVDRLYRALEARDWDAALALYGTEFFRQTSPEAWRARLADLQSRLGPIQGRELIFKQKDAKFRYDAYIFAYLVRYKHGKTEETLTIFKPVDAEEMAIVAHHILEK